MRMLIMIMMMLVLRFLVAPRRRRRCVPHAAQPLTLIGSWRMHIKQLCDLKDVFLIALQTTNKCLQ